MKNYYYILGVSRNATIDEIKTAFRKLSKKFHPDVNSNDKFFEERFKDIIEAYELLSDIDKKKNYDNLLKKNEGNSIENIEKLRKEFEEKIKEFETHRKNTNASFQKEREDFKKQKEEFLNSSRTKSKETNTNSGLNHKKTLVSSAVIIIILLLLSNFYKTKKTPSHISLENSSYNNFDGNLYWSQCDQFNFHSDPNCSLIKNCDVKPIDFSTADLWELTSHNCSKY